MIRFAHAFQSEWLKRRRSFASSMVLAGSLFTPAVVIVVRLAHYRGLPALYATPTFWTDIWRDLWESMAIFFLPLAAVLATSLVTHIEFRANAWKQVHALPLGLPVLFLAKLAVILTMMVEFLLVFTAGVYLAAIVPYLVVPGVPYPHGSFWSLPLARDNALYFIDCLPIVGAQYLMALRIHNVLVPIGIGFVAWVGAIASVSSKFAIWWPYGYTILNYLKDKPKGAQFAAHHEIHALALTAFVLLTLSSYALFATNREKG